MSIDPIRHLVVLAHPHAGSFNHQIAKAYCDTVHACGQVPVLRDLYALRFDPILETIPEPPELAVLYDLTEIRHCDALVFVYPIWFGLPPAMIKGYVDRVLGAGFKPNREHLRADDRFLAGRHMLSFSTSASSETWLAEVGQSIALREAFDRYLATVFGLAGTEHVHIDSIVEGLSAAYAEAQLERVRETARATCARLLDASRRLEAAGAVARHAAKAPLRMST
ncbi:NAD(P)H-dependent oxidoreductase [Sphingomonas sp. RT2P30]|uniref:NAD(P)H-dependent oxidoreductase n=1 Tax=Parasphingomonas halimpatiens TaxID=3096162 RepID=UPI002FCA7523